MCPFPVTTTRKKQFALIENQATPPPLSLWALNQFQFHLFNTSLALSVSESYVLKLKVRQKMHKTKVASSFLNVFYNCTVFAPPPPYPTPAWYGCILRWHLTVSKVHFHMQWGVHMRRAKTSMLCGAFVLSHAIMTHSFFTFPSTLGGHCTYVSFSLFLPPSLSLFYFLIAHFRCMFSLWGRASWLHFFSQKQPERMNFSSIVNTQQIQYRALFMCFLLRLPLLFGTQKGANSVWKRDINYSENRNELSTTKLSHSRETG